MEHLAHGRMRAQVRTSRLRRRLAAVSGLRLLVVPEVVLLASPVGRHKVKPAANELVDLTGGVREGESGFDLVERHVLEQPDEGGVDKR